MTAATESGTVAWWGRSDPDYARNRVLRACLAGLGWRIRDFRPRSSVSAGLEAALALRGEVDLVWVPAFRHRDVAAAARFARARGIPLVFDPLISAYDKRVDERGRVRSGSAAARRLRAWESRRMGLADCVLADTAAHAAYFREILGVAAGRVHVVPLGADEDMFTPRPPVAADGPPEILFYGSFLPLHGPATIVEAARRYSGPPLRWSLMGEGPLLEACRRLASGLDGLSFEPWIPYSELPARVARADVVLGVFGDTPKAGRVVPNKVVQGLASGRPVVTREASVYERPVRDAAGDALTLVPAANPAALAAGVARLAASRATLAEAGRRARRLYERHYSEERVRAALAGALAGLRHG